MSLNARKAARLESGLNVMARKVLDAVPIAEVWNLHQITQEVNRHGRNVDPKVVQGCLRTLTDAGLIKETMRDKAWIKHEIRVPEETPDMPAPNTDFPTDFAAELRSLANKIDDQGLRNLEEVDKLKAENEQLRQELAKFNALRALLKDM